MHRMAMVFVLVFGLFACKNKDKEKEKNENETNSGGVTNLFKEIKLPYQLTDTGLAKNSDTTSLPSDTYAPLLADSIKNNYFRKAGKLRFTPLAKFVGKEETYYIINASTSAKKAAILMVY